jgi:carnitine O-acetyltransferase
MVHDHFYKVDVMVGDEGIDLPTLEQKIWQVVEDACSRPLGAGVGACSADGRDQWTLAREHLLSLDPINRATLSVIEDSLFVLSLDAHTLKSDVYKSSSPATRTPDLDAHIRNSCSSNGTGRNRWWDKAVGIHVESNGRAGMVGEHSPCDALIPSIVADYVLAEPVGPSTQSMREVKSDETVAPLAWVLDAKAEENIKLAEKTVGELAADSEGRMLWYDEYGVDWIKKVGEFLPLTILLICVLNENDNRKTFT